MVADAGLKHLAACRPVPLTSATVVTDAGLKTLADFKHLERLWLSEFKGTNAGIDAPRAARPPVEHLPPTAGRV